MFNYENSLNYKYSGGSLLYKTVKDALYRDKEKAMKRYNITEDELCMYIIPESINFNLSI